jgi:hypothetical protein
MQDLNGNETAPLRKGGPDSRARPMFIVSRGEVVSLRVRRGSSRLSCVAGRLWITADRDQKDILLLPGETAAFSGGKLVIEALRTATVRLEHPAVSRIMIGAAPTMSFSVR